MDYRIVYGLIIVFLLIEVAVLRTRLNKVHEYIKGVFELSQKLEEQHNNYKEQAKSIREYFDIVKQSNDEVDKHYARINNQVDIIRQALRILMNNNKQKQEEN